MSFKDLLKTDFNRYTQTYRLRGQEFNEWKVFFESLFFKAGFQAVILYRISHWFYKEKLTYLAWFFARLNQFWTGVEIEFNAQIGPGLFIAHTGAIMIGRGTVIGENATIFQGVSFGVKSWDKDEITKFPKIGNNCYFFANSSVLGAITIGDECVIAAHALVLKDMSSGSLAKGVPAEIIPDKGREAIHSWAV